MEEGPAGIHSSRWGCENDANFACKPKARTAELPPAREARGREQAAGLAQVQEPGIAGGPPGGGRGLRQGRAMTKLTMRMIKGDFIVTGPDVEPMKFKSRAEAREWCRTHHPGSPITEIGPGGKRAKPPARERDG